MDENKYLNYQIIITSMCIGLEIMRMSREELHLA